MPTKKRAATSAKAPKKALTKNTTTKPASNKTTLTKASAKKSAAKSTTKKAAAKRAGAKKPPAKKPAFGRSGTAGKAEGDAPVRAWIAALPPGQRAIAERFDAMVAKQVPDLQRALKWSMPIYGRAGHGWFAAFAAFKNHVAVRFFAGAEMVPVPPEGASKTGRSVNYASLADVDEKQLADWIAQALKLPGWGA